MSVVVNKHNLTLIESANTLDYLDGNWWINPVLPDCDQKYWRNIDGELKECSEETRQIIDSRDIEQARISRRNEIEAYLLETVNNAFPDYVREDFDLKLWLASEQANQQVKSYIYPLIAWIGNGQVLMREAKNKVSEAMTLAEVEAAGYDHEAFAFWHQTMPAVTNEEAEELFNG